MKMILKNALLAATLFATAAGFTGCLIPCLCPLFEEKNASFEPSLLGMWVKDGETFEFTKVQDKKEYRITNTGKDGNSKATLSAWLGKIGDKSYLCAVLDPEALPDSGRWFACPGHVLIFRVVQTAPELKVVMLDFAACKKLLKDKPDAVAHVMLKQEEAEEKNAIPFLTASTANLQKFIAEYGDKAGLFPENQTMTFTRPVAEEK